MADPKNLRFQKTNHVSYKQFNFDSNMLELFLAVDGKKSVFEIAQEIPMDPEQFKANFLKLVKLGLIEKVEAVEEFVPGEFVENMRRVVIGLIGPLGDILVEDTAKEMGVDTHRIPISTLPHFITILAREIPSTKQSNAFRETMLEEMKSMGL